MARITKVSWWCPAGHRNPGGTPSCADCGHNRIERHAQVHQSEMAVVYRHPVTGEYRTPPRADTPIPQRYVDEGFERYEIQSMSTWEKVTGSVHEATNFNPGNEPLPQERHEYKPKPEAVKAIAEDIASAIASGPWTGQDKLTGLV